MQKILYGAMPYLNYQSYKPHSGLAITNYPSILFSLTTFNRSREVLEYNLALWVSPSTTAVNELMLPWMIGLECPCKKYTASAKSAEAWIFSNSVSLITSLTSVSCTISWNMIISFLQLDILVLTICKNIFYQFNIFVMITMLH